MSASAYSPSSLHAPEEAVPIPLVLLNPIQHGLQQGLFGVWRDCMMVLMVMSVVYL